MRVFLYRRQPLGKVIAGYYIGQYVQFDLNHRRISNFDKKNHSAIKEYLLRDTMLRLLLFLLQNANDNVVPLKDILYHVWDRRGLQSSSQRLWQVMQLLQLRLLSLHVPPDFITYCRTAEGKGVRLKGSMIKPYYLQKIVGSV